MGEQRGSFHIKRHQKPTGINPQELLVTTHHRRVSVRDFSIEIWIFRSRTSYCSDPAVLGFDIPDGHPSHRRSSVQHCQTPDPTVMWSAPSLAAGGHAAGTRAIFVRRQKRNPCSSGLLSPRSTRLFDLDCRAVHLQIKELHAICVDVNVLPHVDDGIAADTCGS
jgi:hypothetical protein